MESQSIAKSKKRRIKNTFFINEFDNSMTIQNFKETFTIKFLLYEQSVKLQHKWHLQRLVFQ